MALSTGSFTVHGASASVGVVLTTDQYSLGLASSTFGVSNFGTTSGMASLMATEILNSANASYFTTSSSVIAVGPSLGSAGVITNAPTTVVGGDGTSLLFTGLGNSTVITGNGNDSVIAPTGNDTIATGGGNNFIQLGSGNSYVDSASTDTIFGGSGTDTIAASGTASIAAGTGGLSVLGAGASVTVFGANVTAVTIYGGSGSTEAVTGSAHNDILAANDSLKGSTGGSVVFDGSSATGGNQFWAGSGNATLLGGIGNDTLVAGQGASTMTGGLGTNEFDFFSVQGGSGTQVAITDFEAGGASDTLKLFNYGASAAASALSSAQQSGNNTVITLSDSSTITLLNFSKSNLTQAEIVSTAPTQTT